MGSFGGILLVFLLGSFMSFPHALQDSATHMAAAAIVGFIVQLHSQLFGVFPALAFLPLFCCGVLAHFTLQGKRKAILSPVATKTDIRSSRFVENTNNRFYRISTSKVNHLTRRASLVEGTALIKEARNIVCDSGDDESESSFSVCFSDDEKVSYEVSDPSVSLHSCFSGDEDDGEAISPRFYKWNGHDNSLNDEVLSDSLRTDSVRFSSPTNSEVNSLDFSFNS
jgi:hypothetical protein